MKLDLENGTFLAKIIATFIIQLMITFGVMEYGKNKQITLDFLPLIMCVVGIIVLMIIIIGSSFSVHVKFMFFCLFSVLFGFILSSDMVKSKITDENIKRALFSTVAIFLSMFILGLFLTISGYDLSKVGIVLFVCLSVLLIFQFVNIFVPVSESTYIVWNYLGLLLFSFYVIFDINQILVHRPFGDDYVASSLGIYLDFINIFTRIKKN